MAIFGMNGLKFLGLDAIILFALYGTKIVALTKEDLKTVSRVFARAAVVAQTNPEKKKLIAQWRAQMASQLTGERYSKMDPKFKEAYLKKTWLR